MLVGNLGQAPEVRTLGSGNKVVNLSVATSENWRDKNTGERKEKTEWHRVVIFSEGLCKVAEQYLKKGSKVYLEGQLQTRKWQDQSGADKYSTEIVLQRFNSTMVLLDSRGEGGAGGGGGGGEFGGGDDFGGGSSRGGGSDFGGGRGAASAPAKKGLGGGGSFDDDLDDDVPF